jgi:hypothetical protein
LPPRRIIQWTIPLSVEYASQMQLVRPSTDEETDWTVQPTAQYTWQPRRRVATMAFGGNVQDEGIAQVRKRLYERVLQDGLVPLLHEGRPQFLLWQNSVKACYTKEGLGMAVYDYRPQFVQANEVGIELEV